MYPVEETTIINKNTIFDMSVVSDKESRLQTSYYSELIVTLRIELQFIIKAVTRDRNLHNRWSLIASYAIIE